MKQRHIEKIRNLDPNNNFSYKHNGVNFLVFKNSNGHVTGEAKFPTTMSSYFIFSIITFFLLFSIRTFIFPDYEYGYQSIAYFIFGIIFIERYAKKFSKIKYIDEINDFNIMITKINTATTNG